MIACTRCAIPKSEIDFRFLNDRQCYRTICKECDRISAAQRFKVKHDGWACRTKEYRSNERRRAAERNGLPYQTREQLCFDAIIRRKQRSDVRDARRKEREAMRLRDRPLKIEQERADRAADYHLRYHTDLHFRNEERKRAALIRARRGISYHLSWYIRLCFKGKYNRVPIEHCLGYSLAALRAHIEAQFTGDMTWQQYLDAEIVIDHVKPLRLFDLLDAKQFSEAWSLDNLQPLTKKANLYKAGAFDAAAA